MYGATLKLCCIPMEPISTLIRLPILMYHKIACFNRTNEDGITLVILHLYIHLFISILTGAIHRVLFYFTLFYIFTEIYLCRRSITFSETEQKKLCKTKQFLRDNCTVPQSMSPTFSGSSKDLCGLKL